MATGKKDKKLIVGGGYTADTVQLFQGSVIAVINGETFEFKDDGSTEVEVHLLGGDDTLVSTIANNTVAYGGDGDDDLQLGSGNDRAYGEAGNDTLRLGAGNDFGDGGDGNDHVDGQSGSDQVVTGNGTDTVVTDADDNLGDFGLHIVAPHSLTADSVAVRGQQLTLSAQFPDSSSAVHWNFGDGGEADGPEVTHVFASEGTYHVELQVVDSAGNSTTIGRDLTIGVIALQVDPENPMLTALAVGGTLQNDNIQIVKHGSRGEIKVLLDGESLGLFSPDGHVLVYGQDGDDRIHASGSVRLATWLFGGAGNDDLNGGNGPNVLDGGDGDDLLIGGSDRDLLVGGPGRDQLIGNGGDDILIGGELVFAPIQADQALAAITREWNSDRCYDLRVSNLKGVDHCEFDQRANGQFFLKTEGDFATVGDDEDADKLTGSAGVDWFFADLDDDRLTDRQIKKFFEELLSEL